MILTEYFVAVVKCARVHNGMQIFLGNQSEYETNRIRINDRNVTLVDVALFEESDVLEITFLFCMLE